MKSQETNHLLPPSPGQLILEVLMKSQETNHLLPPSLGQLILEVLMKSQETNHPLPPSLGQLILEVLMSSQETNHLLPHLLCHHLPPPPHLRPPPHPPLGLCVLSTFLPPPQVMVRQDLLKLRQVHPEMICHLLPSLPRSLTAQFLHSPTSFAPPLMDCQEVLYQSEVHPGTSHLPPPPLWSLTAQSLHHLLQRMSSQVCPGLTHPLPPPLDALEQNQLGPQFPHLLLTQTESEQVLEGCPHPPLFVPSPCPPLSPSPHPPRCPPLLVVQHGLVQPTGVLLAPLLSPLSPPPPFPLFSPLPSPPLSPLPPPLCLWPPGDLLYPLKLLGCSHLPGHQTIPPPPPPHFPRSVHHFPPLLLSLSQPAHFQLTLPLYQKLVLS